MEAPCPVLLAYVCALREELQQTPTLYEPEIEELDLLEARVRVEPDPQRARNVRDLRAFRCLELALGVCASNRMVAVVVPESSDPIEAAKEQLADTVEGHMAAAGDIGLVGVRKEFDQSLRYAKLGGVGDLAAFCMALAELVQECVNAPNPDADLEKVGEVGRLFHRACVMGKLGAVAKVQFAKDLVVPPTVGQYTRRTVL